MQAKCNVFSLQCACRPMDRMLHWMAMATSPVFIRPAQNPKLMVEPSTSTADRVVAVGRELAAASQTLLDSLRTPVRTSSDLVKAAGVNKDIAGRFLTALAKRDPLAVVYYMPGVE